MHRVDARSHLAPERCRRDDLRFVAGLKPLQPCQTQNLHSNARPPPARSRKVRTCRFECRGRPRVHVARQRVDLVIGLKTDVSLLDLDRWGTKKKSPPPGGGGCLPSAGTLSGSRPVIRKRARRFAVRRVGLLADHACELAPCMTPSFGGVSFPSPLESAKGSKERDALALLRIRVWPVEPNFHRPNQAVHEFVAAGMFVIHL